MKRFISLLLCLALCVSFAVPSNAAATELKDETIGEKLPLVIVRGMDFTGLWLNEGKENEEPAIRAINAKEIVSTVLKAVGTGIKSFSITNGIDVLLDYAEYLFENLACDKSGKSIAPVSAKKYPLAASNYNELMNLADGWNEYGILKSSIEKLGGDYTYYYNYDWRLSPLDNSDEIADMVSTACADHGCEKVNLVCASMGGMMTVGYISEYGYSKLNKCIFLSSSFCGAYVADDLLNGKVSVDSSLLYSYIVSMTKPDKAASVALKFAAKIGILSAACRVVNRFIDKYKDYIFDNFVRDTFGYMPALWALVLDDGYDSAVNCMFGDCREENKDFIKITDELHQMVTNKDALLHEMQENGVGVAVVASYDTPLIPVYARATENGDGTLESEPMSGMAKIAPFGKTLGKDYIPDREECLSPDRVADTSHCLFPDNTWLIKGGDHVSCSYGTDAADFLFWLLAFNGEANVTSSAKYPRFMVSETGCDLAAFS